jgi:dTDP-glucose 4,6-dehydratase
MSLMAFYKRYNFPVSIARFANFYGAHQQLYRIIPRTILYSLVGKKLQLHGGGTSQRAFIHGDDVATGIDAIVNKGKSGEIYHFSAGVPVSIAELVKKICTVMSVEFNELVEISNDRPGKDALYSMSSAKAEKELDWRPKISLEQGLDQTVQWVRSNIDVIKTLPLEYMHKS